MLFSIRTMQKRDVINQCIIRIIILSQFVGIYVVIMDNMAKREIHWHKESNLTPISYQSNGQQQYSHFSLLLGDLWLTCNAFKSNLNTKKDGMILFAYKINLQNIHMLCIWRRIGEPNEVGFE